MSTQEELSWITDENCKLQDNAKLVIGDGSNRESETVGDVTLHWDGTNLILTAAADDSLVEVGDSASTQKSFDLKWYANEASGASYLYADASANLLYTTGVDLQFKDDDFLVFGTGAGATGDVQLEWDTTGTDSLRLTATADDTPFEIGNGTQSFDVFVFGNTANDYLLWDASDNGLEVTGAARLDFSGATVAAANTDGGIIKAGTSGARVVEDTADMKFVSLYFDDGATSGDARGIYNRLYITGAGGGGESLRSFTTVEDVAGATAHGAHLSLNFGASGTLTGLGVATRSTLHVPDTATQAGTLAAVQAEIWSDGATSDPAGSLLSVFRVVNGGNATGMADVDTDAFLFDFAGWTPAGGSMISAVGNEPTWTSKTYKIKSRLPDGTACYLVAVID